jgi:general secretion pathway protein E
MINIPLVEDVDLYPELLDEIDADLAIKYGVLPTKISNKISIVVNGDNLSNSFVYLSKLDIDYPIVKLDQDSFKRLNNRFLEVRSDKSFSDIEHTQDEDDEELDLVEFLQNSADILTSEESAPIIKFVNSLFYQAVKQKASDIHIETHEFKGEVRFRVDGVLVKHVDLNKKIASLVISRIKVISNLDIAEKRVPQDGRTQIKIAGTSLDIRVSALPTYYGERIVMRILMQSEDIPHMEELGFSDLEVSTFRELLKHSHGMILVTGPTGSGKSTTLHTFLQEVASPYKNIITVEDPVEYKADNINQIQVNTKVGLTFASGLRSILRQDPDIIMIGEIRDSETAEIAVQSALTGHLVLSTLHTNNSTASIARLVDMEVENFLIGSSLLGVLAQRLVRTLCSECKEEDFVAEEYATEFDLPINSKIYSAKGCTKCNFTGYAGRRAVGEIFVIDDDVKSLIKDTSDDYEIRKLMKSKGMNFLSDKLKNMLLNHETSLEEVIRVGIKDA